MANDAAAAVQPTVLVVLPPALVRLFPNASPSVELSAGTVGAMIDALDQRWPGMADRLRDSRPAIRRNINVFVEGRRATLGTPLAQGTEVFVLTSIAGG